MYIKALKVGIKLSSYISNYKKRIGLGCSTPKEKRILQLRLSFKKYLKETPTCIEVPITDINEVCITEDTKRAVVAINDITNNDKRSLDEKNLLVESDLNVDVGCYLFYDNCYWLTIFKEHKEMDTYKHFIIKRCNQFFNYKYKGQTYKIPLSVENLTLYSDGMADNKYTSVSDTKRQLYFGSNPITKTIDIDTRIMLTGKTVFRVTSVNDFEYNGRETGIDGLIKAICLQDALISKDDTINNIAYNELSKNDNVIIPFDKIMGDEFINLGEENEYTIDYMRNVEWLLDKQYRFCNIINQNEKTCTLQSETLAKYSGLEILLLAKDKETNETIDTKKITLRG
ncbi:hypothetical protein [Clostridioides difficile]|uniref:hypothetical protein n=1 Tax=Clostridioides difficile TaxID=1496 RepID=UPI001C1A4749|nr:hypothetical protein [Clostridioides difficile]HBF5048922.1 hypothetical protein [Clostridioides difficile]HBF5114816.1 hypothetical protein [Clostridioides difficile]HBF5876757.1 hypothetical protein [Clostridioides difficile]HBG4728387.1 hypothetical protein [Clostridioides difficile]